MTKYFDFIVVGSGVAGLRYALEVSKHGSVAVITKAEPHESNTNYAQGGVSAVLSPSDSVENHMRDTIIAGAYLCDEETVRVSSKYMISYNSYLWHLPVFKNTFFFIDFFSFKIVLIGNIQWNCKWIHVIVYFSHGFASFLASQGIANPSPHQITDSSNFGL